MINNLDTQIDLCLREIEEFDFSKLNITDYNKEYIDRLRLAFPYHFFIYKSCFQIIMKSGILPETATLIDYGGGTGLISIIAYRLGFKKVIYCDYNLDSVKTFNAICERLNIKDIVTIVGGSKELLEYCHENKITSNYLISTDVIEHVYDLDSFFADLRAINPEMEMIFTTASNPKNKWKCCRLRKIMKLDEIDFFKERLNFIKKNAPSFDSEKQLLLTKNSRGLHYNDILQCIEKDIIPNPINDKYNTCDPKTGSWTERILSIKEYEQILLKNGFILSTSKGFYNTYRNNKIAKLIAQFTNIFIQKTGKTGYYFAPFMFLKAKKNFL